MPGSPIIWSPGVSLESIERQVITKAMGFYGGNKTQTANALGIAVRTLDNKLTAYAEADEAIAKHEAARKNAKELFLRRSRGEVMPDDSASHGAYQRNGVEPAQGTTPQHAMPVQNDRAQVQSVLPSQASASGSGKRR